MKYCVCKTNPAKCLSLLFYDASEAHLQPQPFLCIVHKTCIVCTEFILLHFIISTLHLILLSSLSSSSSLLYVTG
jgi:hypothetical protein